MAKAKTLDRVELTRRKMQGKNPVTKTNSHKVGYSVCEFCGAEAVVHEGGYERCENCGWSKCG